MMMSRVVKLNSGTTAFLTLSNASIANTDESLHFFYSQLLSSKATNSRAPTLVYAGDNGVRLSRLLVGFLPFFIPVFLWTALF